MTASGFMGYYPMGLHLMESPSSCEETAFAAIGKGLNETFLKAPLFGKLPVRYARQRKKHAGCPKKSGKGKGTEDIRLKIDENRMCHQTEAKGWNLQGIV